MNERSLMLQLKYTSKEWRAYMKRVALEAGIPEAFRPVIVYLHNNPGKSQKTVAAECRVTGAAISRTISDMLRDGYIIRQSDQSDGRLKLLYLTEKGEDSWRRMHEKLQAADERIAKLLTPEKEKEVTSIMAMLEEFIRGGLEEDA